MKKQELAFRQVHLDFHTSEEIPGIGSAFDPDEFADTLDRARVNSITCFARCHHGWLYYPSVAHPERVHPNLKNPNLLREQIEACRKRGIRAPVYITVQTDFYTARTRPEWLIIGPKGEWTSGPYEAGFWRRLCVNTPYADFLKDHTREVMETFRPDGLFFDIVQPFDCSCPRCLAGMSKEGVHPERADERMAFARRMIERWMLDMTRFVRRFSRTCTVFYNAGHVGPRIRRAKSAFSHFELESLPSGGWGYLHFPLSVRYARNFGRECLGMTGKFQTSWGDFHSYKNLPALEYECYQMLAHGAKCSVGDQLHPSGRIDAATYELIGRVYREVERKEPWCRGARPVTEIGVFTPEEFQDGARVHPALAGATTLLAEAGLQFDIIDSTVGFSRYRALVLPDRIPVGPVMKRKLDAYLKRGGRLLASFESGLAPDGSEFALDALGATKAGDGPVDRDGRPVRGRAFPRNDFADYLVPRGSLGKGLPAVEHVMYMRGMEIRTRRGASTLARVTRSYFDRNWRRFCSHRQAPSSGRTGGPAVVRKGNSIYFGHPVFETFHLFGPEWISVLVRNALESLMPDPVLRHDGPTTLQATLTAQPSESRWVLHALHYIPERRCQSIDLIKDVIPLHGVRFRVRVPRPVRRVTLVPENRPLEFMEKRGVLEFTVPVIAGHAMADIGFGGRPAAGR